jgi:uncharacterized membrane protein
MAGGAASPQAGAAGLTDNVAGALCYLAGFVTGVLFLVLAPYNQNRSIRFHAFQSIFLNVAALLVSIALSVVIGVISFVGGFFGFFLGPLIWLGFLGLWLYLMISTYQGKTVILPVIGEMAQKQA